MGKAAAGVAAVYAAVSSFAAIVMVAKRLRSRSRWNRAACVVRDFEKASATPTARLRHLVDAMAVEMHAGLASEGGSKLKMLLTFLTNLPTGEEKGVFYSADLRFTFLRLLQVTICREESKNLNFEADILPVPQGLLSGTTQEFFDFVVSGLDSFLKKPGSALKIHSEREMELTFSFPFPLKHQSVSSGKLLILPKDFQIQDSIDKDIGSCLQQAINRKHLNMRVAALANDTVGTLAKAHYSDKETIMAVIFGTETNACYIERANAITKCQLPKEGSMVINIEWGKFWSSHLPWTSYDEDLLSDDSLAHDQSFGRLISGLYLGEILRRIILRIVQESDVLGGTLPECLLRPFMLKTSPHISAMDQDDSMDLKEVDSIMKDVLGITSTPMKIRRLVKEACILVIDRAARLAASGIVGILKKLGRDGAQGVSGGRIKKEMTNRIRRTCVAIDGALYEDIPRFRRSLHSALLDLLGDEAYLHTRLVFTKDGSGVGAALIAACNSIYIHN